MSIEIKYVSSDGAELSLTEWPFMIEDMSPLLEYSWEFESVEKTDSGSTIIAARQKMKEQDIKVQVFADTEEDFLAIQRNMVDMFDRDILAKHPGKLFWNDVYLNCYISGGKDEDFDEDFETTDKVLTITAENPFWIREQAVTLAKQESEKSDGLNYPHNYPFNYAVEATGARSIEVDAIKDSEFCMIMYGPCSNPEVRVNGHRYGVKTDLLTGDYLMIDTRRKSIIEMPVSKVQNNGTVVNLFDYRLKEESILEKIKPGTNKIEWSGAFKVDLTIFTERSTPV